MNMISIHIKIHMNSLSMTTIHEQKNHKPGLYQTAQKLERLHSLLNYIGDPYEYRQFGRHLVYVGMNMDKKNDYSIETYKQMRVCHRSPSERNNIHWAKM